MTESWSNLDFKKFADAENKINQPYDEALISVFAFDDKLYYAEHNEPLEEKEVGEIIGLIAGALFKIGDYKNVCGTAEEP